MPTLSVIVITKNEAANIGRCLRSIATWADEIIVLDSGSTDDTVSICQRYTHYVYSTDWPGFGPQKQRALACAHGDWILSLDADEWVPNTLRHAIEDAIYKPEADGYYLPRLTRYCGRFQRHGDAAQDKVLRLFRRDKGEFTSDIVHEKIICQGRIGCLPFPLLHNSYRAEREWATQMHHYAMLTAQLRHAKGRRSHPPKALLNSLWIFFRSYIWRQGFRDGHIGYVFAKLNAISSFRRNMQLWNLGKKNGTIWSLTASPLNILKKKLRARFIS